MFLSKNVVNCVAEKFYLEDPNSEADSGCGSVHI